MCSSDLDFLAGFADEREHGVWQAVVVALGGLSRLVDGEALDALRARVRTLVGPTLDDLGGPEPGESDLTGKLRGLLTRTMGSLGADETTIERCRTIFANADASTDAELLAAEQLQEFFDENEMTATGRQIGARAAAGMSRQDSTQIVEEVRMAARQEIDRAAQEFSDRATTAVRRVSPLISEYTSKFAMWFRRALIIAFVVLAAYFVFQVIAQQAFFDWLGDRIDNLETGQIARSLRQPSPLIAQGQLGLMLS